MWLFGSWLADRISCLHFTICAFVPPFSLHHSLLPLYPLPLPRRSFLLFPLLFKKKLYFLLMEYFLQTVFSTSLRSSGDWTQGFVLAKEVCSAEPLAQPGWYVLLKGWIRCVLATSELLSWYRWTVSSNLFISGLSSMLMLETSFSCWCFWILRRHRFSFLLCWVHVCHLTAWQYLIKRIKWWPWRLHKTEVQSV